MIVQKFGGTSVQDEAALERLARIVRGERNRSPLVVVSAMGRTTNSLLEAGTEAAAGRASEAVALLETLAASHRAVATRMARADEREGLAGAIDLVFRAAAVFLERLAEAGADPQNAARLRDALLATGEIASSAIVAAALRASGLMAEMVDIRSMLLTGDDHGRAQVLFDLSEPRLKRGFLPRVEAGAVPVTQGFIGATEDGVTTTIGRGGSDYSAAILGAALGADEIQIWTDVDGVMTTDPRVVPEAAPIEVISFAEAAELAYFGAKVLHPSTIHPAMARDIPVRVLNSRNPEENGTTILREAPPPAAAVRAIAMKGGITVVRVASDRMLMAYGFLARLFEIFSRHQTPVDMVTTSEVTVSMTLDDTRHLDQILEELSTFGEVHVSRDQAIICLVGDGLRSGTGLAARVLQAVRDLPVSMISHGASAINISFVVPGHLARTAVTTLHSEFFSEHRLVR